MEAQSFQHLITVIIPVYNTESYLAECLQSVISQTYRNLEVIIVDDGSTDGSLAICQQFAKLYHRLRVLKQDNRGAAQARLTAFNKSRGDYIVFLDSDDMLKPKAIELLMEECIRHKVGFVTAGMYKKQNGKWIYLERGLRPGYYSRNEIDSLLKNRALYDLQRGIAGFSFEQCGKIYSRKYAAIALQFGLGLWFEEDMVGILKLLYTIPALAVLSDPIYLYRTRPGQATHLFKEDSFSNLLLTVQKFKTIDTRNIIGKQISYRFCSEVSMLLRKCVRSGRPFQEFRTLFSTIRKNKDFQDAMNSVSFGNSFKFNLKLLLLKFDCCRIYYLMLVTKAQLSR